MVQFVQNLFRRVAVCERALYSASTIKGKSSMSSQLQMRLKLPSKPEPRPADDAWIIRLAHTAYLDSECRMDSEWAVGWTLCTQASGIRGVVWADNKKRGLFYSLRMWRL